MHKKLSRAKKPLPTRPGHPLLIGDRIRTARDKSPAPQDFEESLNSFDINLNLPNRVKNNIDGDDRLLANSLATMWKLRLQQLYPTRRFVVRVLDDEVSVSFYQIKKIGHAD